MRNLIASLIALGLAMAGCEQEIKRLGNGMCEERVSVPRGGSFMHEFSCEQPDLLPLKLGPWEANAIKDGDETDVDCGGERARTCLFGNRCAMERDCIRNTKCLKGTCDIEIAKLLTPPTDKNRFVSSLEVVSGSSPRPQAVSGASSNLPKMCERTSECPDNFYCDNRGCPILGQCHKGYCYKIGSNR